MSHIHPPIKSREYEIKPKTQFYLSLILVALFIVFVVWVVGQTKETLKKINKLSPLSNQIYTLPVAEDLPINRTYHGYQIDSAGMASWYDYDFPKGSGNWITKEKYVAASRFFPRGTKLRVCNKGVLDTNSYPTQCVVVTVTDYGPEEETGRIIDMGSLAFSKICALKYGVCEVLIKKN